MGKGWMSGGERVDEWWGRVDEWWVKRKGWITCKEEKVDEWWVKGG